MTIITKNFVIDCPSVMNVNRFIDIDCHRLSISSIVQVLEFRFQETQRLVTEPVPGIMIMIMIMIMVIIMNFIQVSCNFSMVLLIGDTIT